jgi:predicted secreted hydrolase
MIHQLPILLLLAGQASPVVWQQAVEPRVFSFPRDHAAHGDYRVEWWYYTGNVQAEDGRRFGYELTFFRTGVIPEPKIPSRWAVRDLYVAHFALSDLAVGQFRFFQRVKRSGVGWAGASGDRYRVWNGDWEVHLEGDEHLLSAREEGHELRLRLKPCKPPVLHGVGGLSQKGPSRGNASHYYSLTRLDTSGTLALGGRSCSVTGQSWMDHEFSSSFLEKGQVGWDWLSIQLDDHRELMIYQIRHDDGQADPCSSGTIIAADGRTATIRSEEFTLTPGKRWTSPQTGAEYPIRWRLRMPARRLDLTIEAALAGQELDTRASVGFPYWEGSVGVQGTWNAEPIHGRGYLEMTGYSRQNLPARP